MRLLEKGIRAISNDKRCQILGWLKDPRAHFRPQIDGDLVEDGVCGILIAEKLGVSQPTASAHLKMLLEADLITATRKKQWIFYRRNEKQITGLKLQLAKL